jgi:hypothetical protein
LSQGGFWTDPHFEIDQRKRRFFIGLRMWDRARFPPARLFAAVAELSEIEAANWG